MLNVFGVYVCLIFDVGGYLGNCVELVGLLVLGVFCNLIVVFGSDDVILLV